MEKERTLQRQLMDWYFRSQKNMALVITAGGLILVIFSCMTKGETVSPWLKVLLEVTNTLGGTAVSIGLISITYELFKEKKTEEKEQLQIIQDNEERKKREDDEKKCKTLFLLDKENSPSSKAFRKRTYFIYKANNDYGSMILPILPSSELIAGELGFKNLLDNPSKLGDEIWVFGSTCRWLSSLEKKVINSIKEGVHFKIAMIDVSLLENNENRRKEIESATDAIKNIIIEINKDYKNEYGSIELRYTQYDTPYSFSSVKLKENNTLVRVLDYNFTEDKYSQVFELPENVNDGLSKLSNSIFNHYTQEYHKSLLVRNSVKAITIYIIGAVKDEVSKSSVFVRKYDDSEDKYIFPSIEFFWGADYQYKWNGEVCDATCKNDINTKLKGRKKHSIYMQAEVIYECMTHCKIDIKTCIPTTKNSDMEFYMFGELRTDAGNLNEEWEQKCGLKKVLVDDVAQNLNFDSHINSDDLINASKLI